MALELSLRFASSTQVSVALVDDGQQGDDAAPQPFEGPLGEADRRDLHWYLEVYPVQYTADVDDVRADAIAKKLERWGEALFQTAFASDPAKRLLHRFQESDQKGRLVTVSSDHPAVLGQPWELLREPGGVFLFQGSNRISIRRRLVGNGGCRASHAAQPKDRLHLLMVVARPTDASFIDPRADAQAVLDAIDRHAPGKVTVEFLRPATVDALVTRLEDDKKPVVDILHFDGHGTYDVDGMRGPPNTGYLLFENRRSLSAGWTAEDLAAVITKYGVAMMVLSACQSATVGGEDAMGSVAARLTQAGIPSVLAMTHSVLVATTKALFGSFYAYLAKGQSIGTALDNARHSLHSRPERGERVRGRERVTLKLSDWFVPALYQSGKGAAPLTNGDGSPASPVPWGNLPAAGEVGFFGRTVELWQIERYFVAGIRRLVVHGFGGQGKTALATEAGRWLHRTGMFPCVCFINYQSFQGVDAVGMAVSTLGDVLGVSLINADAATETLKCTATLLVLDNIEALSGPAVTELLNAAVPWSLAGDSRVLVTTRQPDMECPDWATTGANITRTLALDGLGEDDAIAWFYAKMRLGEPPQFGFPDRATLVALFKAVGFHPLSIGLVAEQLRHCRPAELGQRLEALLHTEASPLLASLALSLERLDAELQYHLPKLGVFQGGALEEMILHVTEIPPEVWAKLRPELERTGLAQVDTVPGVESPFIRFHPTLAPALSSRLTAEGNAKLAFDYCRKYYELSRKLYEDDSTDKIRLVRDLVRLELRNLLAAIDDSLSQGFAYKADFVKNVGLFLTFMGMSRYRDTLYARALISEDRNGVNASLLNQAIQGETELAAGNYARAAEKFDDVLAKLGSVPSYERCVALSRRARCFLGEGQTSSSAEMLRQAIAEGATLDPTPEVRRNTMVMQTDFGTVLLLGGDYVGARAVYEAALVVSRELSDTRGTAAINAQLGTVAMSQRKLLEAESRYRKAIPTFQDLGETATEANVRYQLGMVMQEAERWADAEEAYREAAMLRESLGDTSAAAAAWNQLGQLMSATDQLEAAEGWYGKALVAFRAAGEVRNVAIALNNLAGLFVDQPNRVTEATRYAEEALELQSTLDPASAEIWKTYSILAQICMAEGDESKAHHRRQQSNKSFAASPHSSESLRQLLPLIRKALLTTTMPAYRAELEEELLELAEYRWGKLAIVLVKIIDGDHDLEILIDSLNYEASFIVSTILRAQANPDYAATLFAQACSTLVR